MEVRGYSNNLPRILTQPIFFENVIKVKFSQKSVSLDRSLLEELILEEMQKISLSTWQAFIANIQSGLRQSPN